MTNEARELATVRNTILIVTGAAWMLLMVQPGSLLAFAHCPVQVSGAMPLSESFRMLMATGAFASVATGWALMLIAMMSPVLIAPIDHVRWQTFSERRARAGVLFVAGYAAIWMALGGVLMATALTAKLFAPESYLPAAGVLLVALVWQSTPIKQRCLNRCHAHTELAAFGAAADLDALRFGFTHGMWCAGSCWALMLFPMVLPRGHVVAMAAVAVLVFSERLEQPESPCWRWRGCGMAMRILVAQARIRMHSPRLQTGPFSSGVDG